MASLRQLGTILTYLENAPPEPAEMQPIWLDETPCADETCEYEVASPD